MVGGVSTAGLRPGFGLGGRTHVLFIDIVGARTEPGIGAKGLLTVEGVAGVRIEGEWVEVGEVEEEIGRDGATAYECIISSLE